MFLHRLILEAARILSLLQLLIISTKAESCDQIGCFNGGVCGYDGSCICLQQYAGKYCQNGILMLQTEEAEIHLPTQSTNNITLTWQIFTVQEGYAYKIKLPSYSPLCPSIAITETVDSSVQYYSGCGTGSEVSTDSSMISVTYNYDVPVQPERLVISRIQTCAHQGCLNGGTCNSPDPTRFQCSCQPGYDGFYCGTDTFCHPNPCLNSGNCSHGATGPICACPERVTGALCESGFCEDALGAVNDTISYYESPGYPDSKFSDISCNISIHADNNAIVRLYIDDVQFEASGNQSNGFLEIYDVEGTDGKLLERITPSSSHSYNSSLVSSRSALAVYFEALRPAEGFRIHYNQEWPDYCKDVICKNGGSCNPNSHQAFCFCPVGYFGDQCQNYTSNLCAGISEPCLNGGTCIPVNATYFGCQCPDQYGGPQCQIPKHSEDNFEN